MEHKKLIIIGTLIAFTVLGMFAIWTNKSGATKLLKEQSEAREQRHKEIRDSLKNVIKLRDILILEKDCTITRRDEHISVMIKQLHSDDKSYRDSIARVPIEKILKSIRE